MTTRTNPSLDSAIQRVISNPTVTAMSPSIKIYSEKDTKYAFFPIFINEMTITQNPAQSYMDDITVTVPLSASQYVRMYDLRDSGLMATLTIEFITESGYRDNTKDPYTRQYRVMMLDPQDIRKNLRDAYLLTIPDREVTLRLIDKFGYDLRHIRVNGIWADTTLEDVIRHISSDKSSGFGIDSIDIIPATNTHVYKQLVIPPTKGFEEVYDYLQSQWGVYGKGMEFFYTDKKLYVFEPYNNNPNAKNMAIVYAAGENELPGLPSYHQVSKVGVSIVATGTSASADLSQMGAENIGTSVSFLRSASVTDEYVKTTEEGSAINQNAAGVIRNTEASTLAPGTSNMTHSTTTDNAFDLTSQMSKYNVVVVQATWKQAAPYTLRPGNPMKYVYDHDSKLATATGILESVSYKITRASNGKNSISYHLCTASITMRVQVPEKKK
jgi:hypothetical protein